MDNRKMIYIAVGVVVLGAIGFAVYRIVKKPNETKK
jgi:preprotein translocase subunit Sss1